MLALAPVWEEEYKYSVSLFAMLAVIAIHANLLFFIVSPFPGIGPETGLANFGEGESRIAPKNGIKKLTKKSKKLPEKVSIIFLLTHLVQ